jgi:hypothetical protein
MISTPDQQQSQDAQQATATPATAATEAAVPETPVVETAAPDAGPFNVEAATTGDVGLAGEAMNLLSEHKGKLAIGVAATLGMMVYYGWREKRLAKTDPEEYARLQRLKAIMRQSDERARPRAAKKALTRDANVRAAASADSDADAQIKQDGAPGAGTSGAT